MDSPDASSIINDLFPFTWTRPVLDIRIGILTLREKWMLLVPASGSSSSSVHPSVPANILPSPELVTALQQNATTADQHAVREAAIEAALSVSRRVQYPWQIFECNDQALRSDYHLLTSGRRSQPIPPQVQAIAPENIFIEEGAHIYPCMLNAATGPIYIGRNTEIMEGALIRGPFALCEGSIVKMGTKIYGATTIGPYCTVGGEIKNSVLFGYSNKAHDGYLGDAVLGEWCNLGAGTSNSNVKNSAESVKVWHPAAGQLISVGLKCGLLMGDYSRSAINTSFNTGTIVGVCCNVFGEGLTPRFIPSFSWGYHKGMTRYEFQKALRDISNWKKLKNRTLTDAEISTLKHTFEQS